MRSGEVFDFVDEEHVIVGLNALTCETAFGCQTCGSSGCNSCASGESLVHGRCVTCGDLFGSECEACGNSGCESCSSGYHNVNVVEMLMVNLNVQSVQMDIP